MAVFIATLLLISCNQPTPTTQVASSTNTIPIDSIPILQAINTVATNTTAQADDTTAKAKTTPQKPKKPPKKKTTTNTPKNKTDKQAPSLPLKFSRDLAKENKPQKVIGNEYFEVVEGVYCDDGWSGNPYYVGCENCRFCRELFVKNKSKEHLFFKEIWCSNGKKEINMWAEADGVGEHIVFCISKRNTGFEIPPPIPYGGQALISYTVGDPNGQIRYFDVTNLIKWCGHFYMHRNPTPKGDGPY